MSLAQSDAGSLPFSSMNSTPAAVIVAKLLSPCADALTGPVLADEFDCPAIVLTPVYPAAWIGGRSHPFRALARARRARRARTVTMPDCRLPADRVPVHFSKRLAWWAAWLVRRR